MQHMVDSKHFWKNEWKIAHLAPDGSLQWYTGVIDLQVYSNLITIWLQNEFWEIYSIQLKKKKEEMLKNIESRYYTDFFGIIFIIL